MKKRFTTIFTITVAAALVSSIAYATTKKFQAKSVTINQDISEVDLAADLLDAKGDHKNKSPKASDTKKHGTEQLKELTKADNTKRK